MNTSRSRYLALAGGLLLVILVLAGVGMALSRGGRGSAEPTPAPTAPPEKVNTIPVDERPYALITPSSNGRNLTLLVDAIKKPAERGEYEIEYQSGNLLQGAFGRLDVEELPAEYDILLGSCSAGGKCTYHEDVTTGSIKLRFQDPEKYVLKNDWAFINNTAKETTWSSNDAKFVITGIGLATVPYAVILQAPGWSGELSATPVAPIYAVGTSGAVRGNVQVSLRVPVGTEATTVAVYAWDGKVWKELSATADAEDEHLLNVAAAPLYEAYTLVPQQ